MRGQNNRIRRLKNLKKQRWRSSGRLTSYTIRRLLRRGVSNGHGRRRSVTESGLRRLRKQLNARLKESMINKLATLQKL